MTDKRKQIAFCQKWGHYRHSMATWKQTGTQTVRIVTVLLAGLLLLPALVLADPQSSSSSYNVSEVFFGSGGENNACSSNYCSKQALGETAAGNTASNNYQAQAGFNTNRQPYIQFTVSNTNTDLGTLSATTTKTATATFSVRAYLSHGYSVINASDTPDNNGYHMQGITNAFGAASAVGSEQFGINLVANAGSSSYSAFGHDLEYVPDNTFSHGLVALDYNTPDVFKYVKGATVALSNQSSSATNYTVSYLFNVSNVTPGGTYLMRHVLVATATF